MSKRKVTTTELESGTVIEREETPEIPPNIVEEAVVSSAPKKFIQETEWFELPSEFEVKFRKLPPMARNKAEAELNRRMKLVKPKPPVASRNNKSRINEADKEYLEEMALWEMEKKQLEDGIYEITCMLNGVTLKEEILPDEEWLYVVEDFYESLDLSTEDMFRSFRFGADKMRELLYKQFIIFGDELSLQMFRTFFTAGVTIAQFEEAVDNFRTEEE